MVEPYNEDLNDVLMSGTDFKLMNDNESPLPVIIDGSLPKSPAMTDLLDSTPFLTPPLSAAS